MPTLRKQRTIARPCTVSGFGYWSGHNVRVEFHPAEVGHGIVFVRHDLQPAIRIPATVDHRLDTPLRTTLAVDGERVEMIEHILAALAGLDVDNCEVRVDAAEMPGCDGSSLPFSEAITTAGIVSQAAPIAACLLVDRTLRLSHDDAWVEARPGVRGGFTVEYHLDYGADGPIGRQSLSLDVTPETFRRELAPSRTFMRLDEANRLRSQGIATRATTRDLLVFDHQGPIDNRLRYADECVRHKMLDMVGDIALAGRPIIGHIVAHRSGHRLNAALVRVLVEECRLSCPLSRSA